MSIFEHLSPEERASMVPEESKSIYEEGYPKKVDLDALLGNTQQEQEVGGDRQHLSDDSFSGPYTRNLDGKIVDPSTNEPVREGSPEWQKLREDGMI